MLLERILRNLISNAITHTTGGRVLIGCRRVAGQLRIEVWDNGVGIPAAEQERVFWEFHQLGNPERDRSKGLGLGLAIVRRTATLLGHPLALRSQAGRGTAFMLTTPIADPAQAGLSNVSAAPSNARAMAGESVLPGQLVLLVDDDAQNLAGLTMLFESWGCRVIGATSGNALFERALPLAERPSLIVSDYRLRDHETGIHVIERLREEYNDPDLPALLVSGDTDPARLAEAADRGIPCCTSPLRCRHCANAWPRCCKRRTPPRPLEIPNDGRTAGRRPRHVPRSPRPGLGQRGAHVDAASGRQWPGRAGGAGPP